MRESRGLNKVASWIAGYDLFISYRHADAYDYACALEQSLKAKGLMVFRDETAEDAGVSLETFAKRACKARALVVLATPNVFDSRNVFTELSSYLTQRIDKWYRRPFSRIISINVDQALSKAPPEYAEWKRLSDFVYQPETLQAVRSAAPSKEVIERLTRGSKFMRSWTLFICIVLMVLIALLISIAGTSLYLSSIRSSLNLAQAESTRLNQQNEGLKSNVLTLGEESERLTDANKDLAKQTKIAEGNANAARERAGTAEAVAKREEQKARDLTNENISREIALAAMSSMPTTPGKEVNKPLQLAVKAVETRSTPQAVDALRQALLLRSVVYTYRYGGSVRAAAISSDGSRVATIGNGDNNAWVWDSGLSGSTKLGTNPTRATLVGVLRGHTDLIHTIAFSPNGKRIVTASRDGSARIWEPTSAEDMFAHPDNGGDVQEVQGGLISAPRNIRFTRVSIWKDTKKFSHEGKDVTGAAFGFNNRFVVTGGADGTVRLWNIETGTVIRVLINEPNKVITRVVVSNRVLEPPFLRSSGLVLAAVQDATDQRNGRATPMTRLKVISVDGDRISFEPLYRDPIEFGPPFPSGLTALNISGNGRYFAAATPSVTSVYFRDITEKIGEQNRDRPLIGYLGRDQNAFGDPWTNGHKNNVTAIAFSPDNSLVATASDDRAILLWQSNLDPNFLGATKQSLVAILGQADRVTTLAFSSNGQYLIAGSDDGTVFIRSVDKSILDGDAEVLLSLARKRLNGTV